MIHRDSLGLAWLQARAKEKNLQADLLERMIHAFQLVEELSRAGLNFTFKGGTCLALHFNDLQRLSIDVDIEVHLDIGFDGVVDALNRIVESGNVFVEWSEDQRVTSTESSRHIRVQYRKLRANADNTSHVILDIVVVSNVNPYLDLVELSHQVLLTIEPPIHVHIPSVEALLGDKLTAIAARTTGVPLTRHLDWVKQIYDVHRLMKIVDQPALVIQAIERTLTVQRECFDASYTVEEIVKDICHLALGCYHSDRAYYDENLVVATTSGLRSFRNYLVKGISFSEEDLRLTMITAAAYLSCAITYKPFLPFGDAVHVSIPDLPDVYQGLLQLPKTERRQAAYYLQILLSFA